MKIYGATTTSLAVALLLVTACMSPKVIPEEAGRSLILPDNPHINYLGRWDFSQPYKPKCAWTAAGMSLQFEGPELDLWLDAVPATAEARQKNYKCYFAYSLDGGSWQTFEVSRQHVRHKLARGLADITHTLVVRKLTEASIGGTATFRGIFLAEGKTLLPAPAVGKKKILFIGDSITCGYGVLGDSADCDFSPETEHGLHTYAAYTAQALQADFQVVAVSGRGIYRNYGGDKKQLMPHLFPYSLPFGKKSKWDMASWIPDAICINLGTNDFAQGPPDQAAFTKAYMQFIQNLRRQYPRTVIVLLSSPMLSGSAGTTHMAYLDNIVGELQKGGLSHLHRCNLSIQGPFGYGCNYHPNQPQQELNGRELISFLLQLKL